MAFTELLENRTLMSATVFDTAVSNDRLQVKIDLLKFRSDALLCRATLLSDALRLRKDDAKQATTLAPLIATYKTDLRAMQLTLQVDRLTEASNALKDQAAIVGVRRQILKDRGDATALAADRAQIMALRIQLQNDLIAGLNARLATRQTQSTQVFNDGQAIIDAVQKDPNASAQVQADVTKSINDRTTCMNSFETNIQTLITDRTQLVTDLSASQSQT